MQHVCFDGGVEARNVCKMLKWVALTIPALGKLNYENWVLQMVVSSQAPIGPPSLSVQSIKCKL